MCKVPLFLNWLDDMQHCTPRPKGSAACLGLVRCARAAMELTAEELARFDGEASTEIYVSFNGKVYDVSNRKDLYGKPQTKQSSVTSQPIQMCMMRTGGCAYAPWLCMCCWQAERYTFSNHADRTVICFAVKVLTSRNCMTQTAQNELCACLWIMRSAPYHMLAGHECRGSQQSTWKELTSANGVS